MALPQGFLDELRHRVPLFSLIGRKVRLAKSGRHWKGCCPFHHEKSPSFYVYDDHFHCFGCGAHGDAISYVMQGGASFVEAVQQLSSEAGLEMPKPDPRDEPPDHIKSLYAALAAARSIFCAGLFAPEGRAALSYIRDRGITDDSIANFGLGYAADRPGGIAATLSKQDFSASLLNEAGLLRETEEGRNRDFFFRRLMFPINDRKGQPISFGGRILGDGQPKYLNGPETKLFSKRRSLYGLDLARGAIRQGANLMVVEGYLDVISLHQAGLPGAVAPLGTALTTEQLEELWRLSPEPVLCFDGDAAGRRAAQRAVEVALPLLTPQRSLSVALLPEGDDPDTLVRRGGAAAMQDHLARKQPLSAFLFDALHAEATLATPEGKAQFRHILVEAAAKIADQNLANEYRRDLLDRAFAVQRQSWSVKRGGNGGHGSNSGGHSGNKSWSNKQGAGKRSQLLSPPRPAPNGAAAIEQRHRIMVAILLRHPGLLPDVEESWSRLPLPAGLERIRAAMLNWSSDATTLDLTGLFNHLRDIGLDREVAQLEAGLKADGCLLASCRDGAAQQEALQDWLHFFDMMNPLALEIEAAEREAAENPTEDSFRRLTALRTAQLELMHGPETE